MPPQEEPELPGHPAAALAGRPAARRLRHLPAVHAPLLVRGPQLPPGHGHPGAGEAPRAAGRAGGRSPPAPVAESAASVSPPRPRQEILNYISRKEFEPLLRVDQLNLEREKHKVFLRFSKCGPAGTPEDQGPCGSLGSWGPWPRVSRLLQVRRRSPSRPPTATSEVPGTRTPGTSRSQLG